MIEWKFCVNYLPYSPNAIDELIINRIPILLGGGIPLFDTLNNSVKFEHCSTEVLDGGMVKSHYKKLNL